MLREYAPKNTMTNRRYRTRKLVGLRVMGSPINKRELGMSGAHGILGAMGTSSLINKSMRHSLGVKAIRRKVYKYQKPLQLKRIGRGLRLAGAATVGAALFAHTLGNIASRKSLQRRNTLWKGIAFGDIKV